MANFDLVQDFLDMDEDSCSNNNRFVDMTADQEKAFMEAQKNRETERKTAANIAVMEEFLRARDMLDLSTKIEDMDPTARNLSWQKVN